MQTTALKKLVNDIQKYQAELQNVEVKSAHIDTPTRLYDTLSSFSNQDGGGTIIFGLSENQKFKVVGVYDVQDLQKKVVEQCKQMQPPVRPLFTVVNINDKMVVSAEIPEVDMSLRPVYYKGAGRLKGSYIRVGDFDEQISEYEIYLLDQYHRHLKDDLRTSSYAEFSMFDQVKLEKYLLNIKMNKPNLAKLSNEDILNLMGIAKDGVPTLAGIMCFHNYPQAIFPQLCITAVVVPGNQIGQTGDYQERFVANKRIEGTIEEMLEEAIIFVRRNMRVMTIIDNNGKRNDRYEYPITAIREAILNALMHRDYSFYSEGNPIRLVIYNDRLEITNQGNLYGKLTLDTLGKVHANTRNQTLTHILEIEKIAENRYSGIPTINYEMEKAGLQKPDFQNERGSFTIVFKNHDKNDSTLKFNDNLEPDLINFCNTPRTRAEIANYLNKTQYYVVKTIIRPLINNGELAMTLPDKPKSKDQKYYNPKFKN